MDLSFSEEQQVLRENVRRYFREQFHKNGQQQKPSDRSRERWAAFAEMGWLGVLLPEDVGGSDGSVIDVAIILEEFGRNLATEPYLACAVLSARVISRAAFTEQRNALLASMVRGELMVTLAHTEAAARGDVAFVETSAERNAGGEYALSGRKPLVLGGSMADKFAVSARLDCGNGGHGGIAVFIVNRDAPGMSLREYSTIDGRSAADLTLENVVVGQDALLIPAEHGLAAIEEATDFAITGLCAEAIGAMDKVIKVTAEYLKTRRAYGSTLNKFQALQHRVADMLIELELSRSMLYYAFAAFSETSPEDRKRAVSSAKALIGRSAKFVAANGIQLHGAQGMADDYLIGQHFKQMTVLEALFGNSDFHWERCARCAVRCGDGPIAEH